MTINWPLIARFAWPVLAGLALGQTVSWLVPQPFALMMMLGFLICAMGALTVAALRLRREYRQLWADIQAMHAKDRAEFVAAARRAVQDHRADHDCDDWIANGHCELCDRVMERTH